MRKRIGAQSQSRTRNKESDRRVEAVRRKKKRGSVRKRIGAQSQSRTRNKGSDCRVEPGRCEINELEHRVKAVQETRNLIVESNPTK